ncbi:nucleotidyltransferase domain-containing protein [Acidaminobacter sp. JC074]|uniref:nucleotidyltransferase domain-containing protein n=1 Tax=Acidaminobacter sp. JC074 TaxID=2530199 RepID=UPI001F0D75FB|nr:nucleotidyltransferase domain-containing protein [Acidaminobacter sp. JC074]MCH4886255.1 nucleotidyltransferase domain-containing protein [Acidaminobacter sp. JC074]
MTSNIINKLTSHVIEKYPQLDTILLVGSYASGNQTEDSDIDLCIIGEYDGFKRVKDSFMDKDIEFMIAPVSWYYHVIREYERKDNFGTITSMLSNSRILYSCNKDIHTLIDEAKKYYSKGPRKVGMDERAKILTKVNKELEDLMCIKGDRINYIYMKHKFINSCIDNFFILNNLWFVKDKKKLEKIKAVNEDFYTKLHLCFEDVTKEVYLRQMTQALMQED